MTGSELASRNSRRAVGSHALHTLLPSPSQALILRMDLIDVPLFFTSKNAYSYITYIPMYEIHVYESIVYRMKTNKRRRFSPRYFLIGLLIIISIFFYFLGGWQETPSL